MGVGFRVLVYGCVGEPLPWRLAVHVPDANLLTDQAQDVGSIRELIQT